MADQHEDLAVALGDGVRTLRIERRLTQTELAERANVSVGALKNLERGRGSSTTTLVRVAHALGEDAWLRALAPRAPSFNPLSLIDRPRSPRQGAPRRVRHPRAP